MAGLDHRIELEGSVQRLEVINGTPRVRKAAIRSSPPWTPWMKEKLALVSRKSKLAEAICYPLSRWASLARFLDDGRIEIDNNVVERAIRPIALSRKNALFAGSDGRAEH